MTVVHGDLGNRVVVCLSGLLQVAQHHLGGADPRGPTGLSTAWERLKQNPLRHERRKQRNREDVRRYREKRRRDRQKASTPYTWRENVRNDGGMQQRMSKSGETEQWARVRGTEGESDEWTTAESWREDSVRNVGAARRIVSTERHWMTSEASQAGKTGNGKNDVKWAQSNNHIKRAHLVGHKCFRQDKP